MQEFVHILNIVAFVALIVTLCMWALTSTFWWLEQNENAKLFVITRAAAVGCSVVTAGLWVLVFICFETWIWET